MEMLVDHAPAIGSDNKAFQNKVNKTKHIVLSVFQYSITDEVASNIISLRDGGVTVEMIEL